MGTRISGLLAVCLLGAPAANATIINFDMTGLVPGPIYDEVVLDINLPSLVNVSCTIFGNLNLQGGWIPQPSCLQLGPTSYIQDEIVDGLFSISLIYNNVTPDGSPFAYGVKDGVSTQIRVARVPEPNSLILVVLGLVGLALTRRRNQIV